MVVLNAERALGVFVNDDKKGENKTVFGVPLVPPPPLRTSAPPPLVDESDAPTRMDARALGKDEASNILSAQDARKAPSIPPPLPPRASQRPAPGPAVSPMASTLATMHGMPAPSHPPAPASLPSFPLPPPESPGLPAFSVPPSPRVHAQRPTRKVPLLVWGLLGGGAFVFLCVLGLVAVLFMRRKAVSTEARTVPRASSASVGAKADEPPAKGCSVVGSPKSIASDVLLAPGVEVFSGPQSFFFGFANRENEGLALELDPSLSVVRTTKDKAEAGVRRVTPWVSKKGLTVVMDTEKKEDRLVSRRFLPGDPAFDIGVVEGDVVGVLHGGLSGTKIWSVPGEGPVEAARALALPLRDRNYVVAFRRGGNLFTGLVQAVGNELLAKGELYRIQGLGPRLGAPALGMVGDRVALSFSDRASDKDPWSIRMVSFHAGDAPGEVQVLGGAPKVPEEARKSPSVVGISGERFVLVWTEGVEPKAEVRAQALRADLTPLGTPTTVSVRGVNSGQGQAAFLGDNGVVGYFGAASDGKYELLVTSLACPL